MHEFRLMSPRAPGVLLGGGRRVRDSQRDLKESTAEQSRAVDER